METNGKNQGRSGLTMVELLVVIAVIVLLLSIVVLGLADPKRRVSRINCVSNLRMIELALATWSADHSHFAPVQLSVTNGGTKELTTSGLAYLQFQVLSNELSVPKLLVCPADGMRISAASFGKGILSNTNVSYFIGVDAEDLYPGGLPVGDRNLSLNDIPVKPGLVSLSTNSLVGWTTEMHNRQGNIGLADGSVQQLTSAKLRQALQWNGTNRWVVP